MNFSSLQQQPLIQLQQICPLQSSIAFCLNQLRSAKIQFLNHKGAGLNDAIFYEEDQSNSKDH